MEQPEQPAEGAQPGPLDHQLPGSVPLPAPVRDRLAALASARLGSLPLDAVPPPVRRFARFTPAKRTRLAGPALVAALESDDTFRTSVAEGLRESQPELAAEVEGGDPGCRKGTSSAEERAAAAYLLRPEGWQDVVGEVAEQLAERATARQEAAAEEALARVTAQLDGLREASRTQVEALRTELTAARDEAAALRRRVRELGDRAGRAEAAARLATAALDQERARVDALADEARGEAVRLSRRLTEAEAAVAAARQAAREGRSADEIRLRVLLDALLGAAAGLRRELALAPVEARPADLVAADYAAPAGDNASRQGRSDDDPALLDALLSVPLTHLLVDGYNVTKSGYGELSLEAQRIRLLAGLGALAARTGAEVTVVFDGAERVSPVALAAPRGVRLLFSRPGEPADDVLLRLAGLEPQGRPVLVVSADREVAEGARRSGARPVPSRALLRLLERG